MMRLKIFQLDFPQARPVSISFHTWNLRQSFLIFLEYQKFVGLGEANPFEPITGDSAERLIREARQMPSIPLNPESDDIKALHEFLQKHISCKTLEAAIDCAYHDLIGRLKQQPIYRMYAPSPRYVENSITVFLDESLEETEREAVRIYREFPELKILKIKLKGEHDVERARVIKKVSPPQMKFVLDANQGFRDPEAAVVTLSEVRDILGEVILVEEPCRKGDMDRLKFVRQHLSGMMVFADESAATLQAVQEVAKEKAAHGVNIKLQKAGGLWPARQIAEFCQANGLKVMVGAMIEGPVSISAGVHFAVSTPNVVFSDLDTDLDLPQYTTGHSRFADGVRLVDEDPGLGLSLESKTIEKLKREGKLVWTGIV